MSLAKRTREETRRYPFLVEAMRAGVLNYTAAARFLDVGDTEPVAAALRRYSDELPPLRTEGNDVRLRMITGIGDSSETEETLIQIDGNQFGRGSGNLTAIVADGAMSVRVIGRVLWQLAEFEVSVYASAMDGNRLVIVTDRLDGPSALRVVEETLTADSRD